jgi:hypothetical protein
MTTARERLAARQGQLLRALLAGGDPPPGFDPRRVRVEVKVLRDKRRRVVGYLRPDLREALGDRFPELFERYAAEYPKDQGTRAREDAHRFGEWLVEHGASHAPVTNVPISSDAMSLSQPGARIQLSAGIPTLNKVMVFVLTAVAVVVLGFVGLVASALSRSSGSLAVVGPALVGGFAVVAAFALVWGLARAIRSGAYVEGTELVVRGAFTTQRVDLATAQRLRLNDANPSVPSAMVPVLGAYGDAKGRSATVVFRSSSNGFLPVHEVEALTHAIRAGHRTGIAAEQAEQVVRELALRAASAIG